MKLPYGAALCLALITLPSLISAQEAGPAFSLHEAISLALQNSPSLGSAVAQSEAMNAAIGQAAALPNPEMGVEIENVGGDEPYSGFDSAEITYGMSQLVEMPGKLSGRSKIAEGQSKQSLYQRDAVRLDLIRDVVIAYSSVVAAEEELAIRRDEQDLALKVHDSVAAKVDAGKEPPIQQKKAAIELSSAQIALERADRSVLTAREVLSNLLGGQVSLKSISGDTLPAMEQPKELVSYENMLAATPDALAYGANVATAQSSLSFEKSKAVPDPTISIGVRDFREDDAQALVAGLSIPLPVFDANRASIRRAGHEYNAAVLDKTEAMLTAETAVSRSHEALVNAYREYITLRDTVIPGAQEAFNLAREGYQAGKFGYLEVLDGQRTLFQTRLQSVRAKSDYYRELATIDRLTAAHAVTLGEKP